MWEESISCPCLCEHVWPEIKVFVYCSLSYLFVYLNVCDVYVDMYAHVCAAVLAHAYMHKGQRLRLGVVLYVIF